MPSNPRPSDKRLMRKLHRMSDLQFAAFRKRNRQRIAKLKARLSKLTRERAKLVRSMR